MRLTLADEKLWKENVIVTDPLHYRRGNYRVKWFGPYQRGCQGSISEEAYPQLLIVKPIVPNGDLAILPSVLRGRALCQQL